MHSPITGRHLTIAPLTLGIALSSATGCSDQRPHSAAAQRDAAPSDVAAADQAASDASSPLADRSFQKRAIDSEFRAEGVTAFDANNDGYADIVTDQFWYEAPDFVAHAIRAGETFDPETQYSRSNALFAADVNADGWSDVIVVPFPSDEIGWYENPRGDPSSYWPRHAIAQHANGETPVYVDLFGDGRRQLVMGYETDVQGPTLSWLEPAADPYALWTAHSISAPGVPVAQVFAHGLGAGDLNGDGRVDVLTSEGWYEGPVDSGEAPWTWHPFPFHPDECSQMYTWDVNADGRVDVVSSNPHHYGVWWWEQLPTADGADLAFAEHLIDDTFSESHGLRLDDLNADGVPEIITGKRYYSHGRQEPGALDPPLLVYYTRLLDPDAPGGARFVRTVVDDSSGVGTAFEVADISGDALPDIAVSNKLGLFYFERDVRCDGEPAEWIPLFDGVDLAGWYPWLPTTGRRDPKGMFRVTDGAIHVLGIPATDEDQEFGYLATFAEYSHFRVRFDYRWTGRQFNPTLRDGWRLDSGFFVTAVGPDRIWPRALECQVQLGDTGDVYLFDRATLTTTVSDPLAVPPVFAPDGVAYTTPRNENPNWGPSRVVRYQGMDSPTDWNHVEITISGERTDYEVNGRLVMSGSRRSQPSADAPDDPSRDVPLLRGRVVIQEEGAEIFYRNVEITGIGTPACAVR